MLWEVDDTYFCVILLNIVPDVDIIYSQFTQIAYDNVVYASQKNP